MAFDVLGLWYGIRQGGVWTRAQLDSHSVPSLGGLQMGPSTRANVAYVRGTGTSPRIWFTRTM